MSEQIFEQHVDDHGNVSIRVSNEFIVFTRDEAERLRERFDQLEAENAKLRVLCRDMYLVVEILDMDGTRLQAHGKDADWRTLKERFDELMGIGEDE